MGKGKSQRQADGAALEFEVQLWAAADKMRGHMDASEYKHVCLLPKLLSGEMRVPKLSN